MYTRLDEALDALDAAMADTRADFSEEMVEAAFSDLVYAVADDCTTAIAREFVRTQLGDPDFLGGRA